MNKPIWFEKGKYYINTEKINAYYDVNEGQFFSTKTGKPYKGVMAGFASLARECDNESFYDNCAFKFSPKELIFIATCNSCHPISEITTVNVRRRIANYEKIFSMLALPQDFAFKGCDVYYLAITLEQYRNEINTTALWEEYQRQNKGISNEKLLNDFRSWLTIYLKETRENHFRTLMTKYTQNEETLAFFQANCGNSGYDSIYKENNLRRAIYYYERGLRDYYKGINQKWEAEILKQLNTHFQMCAEMNIKPPKENWFVARCQVLKDYTTWKDKLINARLAAAQEPMKTKLLFEDNNFVVIIPTTSDEFVQEANTQHNCVNSWYKSKVADKDTHIVFVRKKNNPSKSYITCEVNNNGYIKQFLLANNRSCEDNTPETDFLNAYQNHLNTVWNA